MKAVTRYQRGVLFPNEGFVQARIEEYFSSLGFIGEARDSADYAGRHPKSGECWVVEAKGVSKNVRVDFCTALGQIIQHWSGVSIRYGLAFPFTAHYLGQCGKLSSSLRSHLNLYLLLVNEEGRIEVIGPSDPVPPLTPGAIEARRANRD
jgi:hypothetical protein